MPSIVTHTNPDWDAIGAVWLLVKFWFHPELVDVRFVNTNNPDQDLLTKADAVVDTGGQLDVARLHFDHHQLPGAQSNQTCATRQVYQWLLLQPMREEIKQGLSDLEPLIALIQAGDTGHAAAAESRTLGLHALLRGEAIKLRELKVKNQDLRITLFGSEILNTVAISLIDRGKATRNLRSKVTYKSADGKLWAIQNGKTADSFAAFEEGAELVVFVADPIKLDSGETTYPVGISRAMESNIHVGDLSLAAIPFATEPEIAELESWFRHNAGFFAGRGTAKAPANNPPKVTAARLAQVIDLARQNQGAK